MSAPTQARRDLHDAAAADDSDASLAWEPEIPAEGVPLPGSRVLVPDVKGGACIVVLGRGPEGTSADPTELHPLVPGEGIDIVGPDPHFPTSFTATRGGVHLDATGARDGVYVRIHGPVRLRHGDPLRIGHTRLRFETAARGESGWGALVQLREDGWPIERFVLRGLGATLGRTQGDVVIARDPWISGRHCRVVSDPTGIYLDDLGSEHGTFRVARVGELLPYEAVLLVDDRAMRVVRGA